MMAVINFSVDGLLRTPFSRSTLWKSSVAVSALVSHKTQWERFKASSPLAWADNTCLPSAYRRELVRHCWSKLAHIWTTYIHMKT